MPSVACRKVQIGCACSHWRKHIWLRRWCYKVRFCWESAGTRDARKSWQGATSRCSLLRQVHAVIGGGAIPHTLPQGSGGNMLIKFTCRLLWQCLLQPLVLARWVRVLHRPLRSRARIEVLVPWAT
jgi:hypothetical protein